MKTFISLVTLLASLALVQAQNFTVHLNTAQELPAPIGSQLGNGDGTLTLNANNTVTYSITFASLSGGINNAHIHGPSALGGPAAGVLIALAFTAGQTSGTLAGTTAALSAAGVTAMLGGNAYVNIHTLNNTSGEIRGQIVPVPEPSTMTLGALGLGSLLLWMRRRTA